MWLAGTPQLEPWPAATQCALEEEAGVRVESRLEPRHCDMAMWGSEAESYLLGQTPTNRILDP